MNRIFLATAIAIATAGTALAADAPTSDARTTPSMHDWRGSYFGLQIGGAFGDSTASGPGGSTGDYDIDGVIGGYTSGYNWQSGNWVFGIESDTSLTDIDGTSTVLCAATCFSEVEWLSTVRARLGKVLPHGNGNVLVYVTGGLAYGGVEFGFLSPGGRDDETLFGWTIGAGGEIALNNYWSVKGEYLYVDLGDETHATGPTRFDFDEIHIVRVGINRKFNIFDFFRR